MASLYKRSGSPFWWIKYRLDSKIIRQSTGFRVGIGIDTRKAQELKAEKSLLEAQQSATGENWLWVTEFFSQRYRNSPKTHQRYGIAWKSISVFLEKRQIRAPRLLTYTHVLEYVKWRQNPDDTGLYRCSLNNAISEVKILGLIMREAIRRGMATINPCQNLGLKEDKPPEKPEMTDEEIAKIRKELVRYEKGQRVWPEWMRISFEIAIHQGCRLRETCLPLNNFDLKRKTLTLDNVKGGKKFTTRLHPGLLPLIKELKDRGRKTTCDMPLMPSKAWWLLFKKLKMRHLCFHCTRVTVVTRLARTGVGQAQAMRFVGHASETIHRVYQRLGVEDLGGCVAALKTVDKSVSP